MGFDPAKRFLSWTSFQNVVDRAKLYFEKGEPYSMVSSREIEKIDDANRIRNRVAHGSRQSREKFKMVALKILQQPSLYQGYDVGDLLLGSPANQFPGTSAPTLFEANIEFFKKLRDKIVP